MKILERIDGPFGGIDERAMTNQLEEKVGVDKCFRLMRIYDASKASEPFSTHKPFTKQENFRERAERQGFSDLEIDAFIDYRSVI